MLNEIFFQICDARETSELCVCSMYFWLLASCAASHAANINNIANEDCVKHTQIDEQSALALHERLIVSGRETEPKLM